MYERERKNWKWNIREIIMWGREIAIKRTWMDGWMERERERVKELKVEYKRDDNVREGESYRENVSQREG